VCKNRLKILNCLGKMQITAGGFFDSHCIDYVDIAGRSSSMGRETRVGWENKLFSSEMRQYLENSIGDTNTVTIDD